MKRLFVLVALAVALAIPPVVSASFGCTTQITTFALAKNGAALVSVPAAQGDRLSIDLYTRGKISARIADVELGGWLDTTRTGIHSLHASTFAVAPTTTLFIQSARRAPYRLVVHFGFACP